MCASSDQDRLVDLEGVGFNDLQLRAVRAPKLFQRGYAAAVAFDGDHRGAGFEQRVREPSRPGPDFVNPLAF